MFSFHYWPVSNHLMPFPCGFWCCLTLWPYILRGQAAHGWKQVIAPLAAFPLVWISSELMSPWASLHCKQWAAKQRDSSLLMRLNRIHLSDALIELGLLQTHTHTLTHTNTHTHECTTRVMRTCWEACCMCWEPKGLGNVNCSLETVVHHGTCGTEAPDRDAD